VSNLNHVIENHEPCGPEALRLAPARLPSRRWLSEAGFTNARTTGWSERWSGLSLSGIGLVDGPSLECRVRCESGDGTHVPSLDYMRIKTDSFKSDNSAAYQGRSGKGKVVSLQAYAEEIARRSDDDPGHIPNGVNAPIGADDLRVRGESCLRTRPVAGLRSPDDVSQDLDAIDVAFEVLDLRPLIGTETSSLEAESLSDGVGPTRRPLGVWSSLERNGLSHDDRKSGTGLQQTGSPVKAGDIRARCLSNVTLIPSGLRSRPSPIRRFGAGVPGTNTVSHGHREKPITFDLFIDRFRFKNRFPISEYALIGAQGRGMWSHD
jgi:hypothetical protein